MREQVYADRLDTDPWTNQHRRRPWNHRIGAETVVRNVSFDTKEWVEVNVQRPFPPVESTDIWIEGIGPQAAISEKCIMIAQLGARGGRKSEQNAGTDEKKIQAQE